LVVDLVVDLVIWAIYRKYEYGDETYYQLIKGKIKEERQRRERANNQAG
jgi:hypothetical protein